MSKSTYSPEKGTEDLVHVSVTKKNGQALEPAKIEHYSPAMWPSVSKLPGFEGEVVHDPRSADAKAQKVSASTVKSAEKLTEAQQYEERYKVLFRSAIPDELAGNEERIKTIVDRAETKLASLSDDVTPVKELVYEQPVTLDASQPITEVKDEPTPAETAKAKGK